MNIPAIVRMPVTVSYAVLLNLSFVACICGTILKPLIKWLMLLIDAIIGRQVITSGWLKWLAAGQRTGLLRWVDMGLKEKETPTNAELNLNQN